MREDTLSLLHLFNQVCTAYQQTPVQANFSVRNSANLVTNQRDTLSLNAYLNIQKKSSLIRINDQEEVIYDSLLLVKDTKRKQLVLSFQKNSLSQNKLITFQQGFSMDSSVNSMASRYQVLSLSQGNQTGSIQLISKERLKYTVLPEEEIVIEYNQSNKEPIVIKVISRVIYPIRQEIYDRLIQKEDNKQYVFVNELDKKMFFVKESRSVTQFYGITHMEGESQQALENYIAKEGENYKPTRSLEDYQITILP